MRPLGRNIPWKSISIPWIRRSKGWKFRSKATFRRKNGVETCHIVAKKPFSAVHAVGCPTDVPEHQTFLIFAYLRARAQARENNRFSMLKNSGADSMEVVPPLLSLPGGERRDESPAAARAALRPTTRKPLRARPFQTKNVSLQPSTRTCGEIGRRARLRIWWLRPCRFESYQVHTGPACQPFPDGRRAGPFACKRRSVGTLHDANHTLFICIRPTLPPTQRLRAKLPATGRLSRKRKYKTASLFLSTRLRYLCTAQNPNLYNTV